MQPSGSCRSLHSHKVSMFDDDGLDVDDPLGCAPLFLDLRLLVCVIEASYFITIRRVYLKVYRQSRHHRSVVSCLANVV
jgi:hypothetical protein